MSLRSLDVMLENDTEGKTRDALISRFSQMVAVCQLDLRKPASPADYQRLQDLRDACVTAKRVVKLVWQRRHAALTSRSKAW